MFAFPPPLRRAFVCTKIPPRDSPFKGPYQSPYHWRAHRFLGPNVEEEEDSSASSSDSLESLHSGQNADGARRSRANPPDENAEPPLIRHSVFDASRDAGPRGLPPTHSETAFRFAVRIPDDAPESYSWAEPKEGCVIEVRYRLFVVFKLRASPRNPVNTLDPMFWDGAHRPGEQPMVVLFAENLVHVDSPRVLNDAVVPRPLSYDIPAGVGRLPLPRARMTARSLLGRRSLSLTTPAGNCVIGEPIKVRVGVRVRGMQRGEVMLRIELIERVVLRQGRRFTASAAVRALALSPEVDKDGQCAVEVELRTDFGDLYPSAFLGGLSVFHAVRVVLWPGERRGVSARAPVTMISGGGQYITRAVHNETLYPARARQPPWRRERSRRLQREREKRESVAAIIDALPEAVVTVECGSDEEEEVCAICLEEITAKRAVMLPCSHMLHEDCVKGKLRLDPSCLLSSVDLISNFLFLLPSFFCLLDFRFAGWLVKDEAGNCPVCRHHVLGAANDGGAPSAAATDAPGPVAGPAATV